MRTQGQESGEFDAIRQAGRQPSRRAASVTVRPAAWMHSKQVISPGWGGMAHDVHLYRVAAHYAARQSRPVPVSSPPAAARRRTARQVGASRRGPARRGREGQGVRARDGVCGAQGQRGTLAG